MDYAENRLDRRVWQQDAAVWNQEFETCCDGLLLLENEAQRTPLLSNGQQQPQQQQQQNQHDYHTRLARLYMALGWNRQAIYHYAMQWMQSPSDGAAAADYAQMAELAGFCEIGLLAVLVYRNQGPLLVVPTAAPSTTTAKATKIPTRFHPIQHLQRQQQQSETTTAAEQQYHPAVTTGQCCGCGHDACGAYPCFLPMTDESIQSVLHIIHDYCNTRLQCQYQRQQNQQKQQQEYQDGVEFRFSANTTTDATTTDSQTAPLRAVPSAHAILGMVADGQPLDLSNDPTVAPAIPKLLQFWKTTECDEREENNATEDATVPPSPPRLRPLAPAVQLLLVKLFYLVLPALSVEAAVYLRFPDNEKDDAASTPKHLAMRYKSHWAYFVFVQSLALGTRIKPGRRRMLKFTHEPLWNRLWGMPNDRYSSSSSSSKRKTAHTNRNSTSWYSDLASQFVSNLEKLISVARQRSNSNADAPFLYDQVWMPLFPVRNATSVFLLGDSHVLSLAWQTLTVPVEQFQNDVSIDDGDTRPYRLCVVVPTLVTGLKAWHFRSSTRFFTSSCLDTMLRQRLPHHVQTILVSAGEIDCREGMGGPLLEGYKQVCHEDIYRTVSVYISAMIGIVRSSDIGIHVSQILVLPVAPHLRQGKGRITGQASRRETMLVWNNELRRQLDEKVSNNTLEADGPIVSLLDYSESLQIDATTYALNPLFNADSTHMNSAFLPLFEKALVESKCDVRRLFVGR